MENKGQLPCCPLVHSAVVWVNMNSTFQIETEGQFQCFPLVHMNNNAVAYESIWISTLDKEQGTTSALSTGTCEQ